MQSQFDTLMVGRDVLLYPDPRNYGDPRIRSTAIPARRRAAVRITCSTRSEIDKLSDQGVATTNLEERKAVYDKIQAILLDDLPFAPIFSYQSIVGVGDRMKGYEAYSYLTSNFWNTQDWTTA